MSRRAMGALLPILVLLVLPLGIASAAEMSKEALATVASRAGQIGTINSIEAVASTAGAAAVAFNPHTVVVAEREANAPVTMWVAHGNFDDTLAKTPPGATRQLALWSRLFSTKKNKLRHSTSVTPRLH